MDTHFPGLASSFIQLINEAIQQKGMTHSPCADPVEKTDTLSWGLASGGGGRQPTKKWVPKELGGCPRTLEIQW